MGYLRSHVLFSGELVRATDVVCTAPASAAGPSEENASTSVVVPVRGVFEVVDARGTRTVDPGTAAVFAQGTPYRVRHPIDGGDVCVALTFDTDAVEESGLENFAGGTLAPRTRLGIALLRRAMLTNDHDPNEIDEAAVGLLAVVTGEKSGSDPDFSRRAEEVRALLAARPHERWRLADVAREVHTSPFHLARSFRAATGLSVMDQLARLRVAIAVERIAAGEDRMARMATELGFSSHSHFSSRFRTLTGMTPSAARSSLTRGRLDDMRTILTVGAGAAA